MRILELLREVAAATWAQKIPALMVALLTGAMCVTTLLTVGRSAAAEEQVAARMESAGSRVSIVHPPPGEALVTPAAVALIGGISHVESAYGLGAARDMGAGARRGEGPTIPVREFAGDLGDVAELTTGRWPRAGEALVTEESLLALGFDGPTGYLADGHREIPVVGTYRALPTGERITNGAVVASTRSALDYLVVIADDATRVGASVSSALQILAPRGMSQLRIESPEALAAVQEQIAGDLGDYSRSLLGGVLVAGSLLIAVVVLADVLIRRADIGRRRALGATRGVIVTLVAGRTAIPALAGTLTGTAAGVALAARMGAAPPLEFGLAVAILAVLAALTAAIPPAIFAAHRDPVAVLRTP
nr:permease [Actinomycetales bacterium]